MGSVETRHLQRLTFSELRRALKSLSDHYIAGRPNRALDSRGKRAAFAAFYGPLHYLMVAAVARRLGISRSVESLGAVVDLGCGTGTCGAAVVSATSTPGAVRLLGIDLSNWATQETKATYAALQLRGTTRTADLAKFDLKQGPACVYILGFVVNELPTPLQDRLRHQLLAARRRGCCVLVIEPIAHRLTGYWAGWQEEVVADGGRTDEWHIPSPLPELLRRLDRATRMNHSVLKCKSLWLPAIGLGKDQGPSTGADTC